MSARSIRPWEARPPQLAAWRRPGWQGAARLSGLLALLAGGAAVGDALPPELRCLERYYGVRGVGREGSYRAVLPDGRELAFADGKAKTAEQRLDDPDLKDIFAQRYPTGPIAPVTTPDFDPGRVRVDALFLARYGSPQSSGRGQDSIKDSVKDSIKDSIDVVPFELFGKSLRVHRAVLPAFTRVRARLVALCAEQPALREFLDGLGGTFVVRNIAGTNRRSAHSYGVSLDINVKLSHYWRWQRPAAPLRWQNRIPQALVDAFEAEGFIWGGRWYHYDTMHFEYRPELLDPSCYSPTPVVPASPAPANKSAPLPPGS